MQQPMTRPGNHVIQSYEVYSDMLFRIALIHLGSRQDAEEATQDTFIKLMEKAPAFKDDEHQKAWLIRVITNHCKNLLGRGWRKREVKLEGIEPVAADTPEDMAILQLVLAMPVKYKTVIHLYYYEDYPIQEISRILQISESAVKMRLQRGRQLLKLELEGADPSEGRRFSHKL